MNQHMHQCTEMLGSLKLPQWRPLSPLQQHATKTQLQYEGNAASSLQVLIGDGIHKCCDVLTVIQQMQYIDLLHRREVGLGGNQQE